MNKYQDYVIKDGKFIGQFEEMYQKFDNPWNQREDTRQSYAKNATVFTLETLNIKTVYEIGCGLGHFTNYMANRCPNTKVFGIDISKTAIEKARESYPHIEFIENDCLHFLQDSSHTFMADAILMAECMWYLLDDLEEIIKLLRIKYRGKYLLINQTFYKGKQEYGREYFTSLDQMIEYLPFKLLRKMEIEITGMDSIASHSVFAIE